jgi:CHAD domain-containing protein/transposase
MGDRLTADERAILTAVAQEGSPTTARRAQIVLAWDEGLEPEQIASRLELSQRTVNRWLQAFFELGIAIFPNKVISEAIPSAQAAMVATSAKAGTPPIGEEGLLTELEPGEGVRITTSELCRRYQVDMAHGQHVGRLAVELFGLTHSLHKLDLHYRDVIWNAGLLHNVAMAGGVAAHHTRGRDILLATPLSDLEDEDRAIIAVTTAFHRKGWSKRRLEKEPSYIALPDEAKPAALALAALIRIADGLDYSQSQTTVLGQCMAGPAGVHISVMGPYAETDAARADEKADLWRALYNTPIHIVPSSEAVVPIIPEAPPLLEKPGLSPDDLMSEAGRKILRFHFRRMLYHEAGTRLGQDIEALHDMRVATRRMRAALRVFGPFFEKGFRRRLLQGLQLTGSALGAVRDLDVFMEYARTYLSGLPPERQHELDPLFDYWHSERESARAKMLAYLESPTYQKFVRFCEEFVETPGLGGIDRQAQKPAPERVRQVAPRQIYTCYEAVWGYEGVIQDAPIATLHALRIDGKRLRYTLEFFREVLGSEVEEVIGVLIKMQDHLGALHDADVSQTLLRSHMEKLLRQARKQQKRALEPPNLPPLGGIVAYLQDRERELERLREGVLPVWSAVIAPETRHKLALALSVL